MPTSPMLSRRDLLKRGFGGLGLALAGGPASLPLIARAAAACADGFGALRPPDANGLRLPPGFRSRVVAISGQNVTGTAHAWHAAPDGGACFPTGDGGWIYASNSELSAGYGGVGALRFGADGSVVDAYTILSGTSRNCAGGPTPWGTWLSCEEITAGGVFECDPASPGSQGSFRPALGSFRHEAAAVDPTFQQVYLTEDQPDGLLYRFTPWTYPDLSAGTLEAAEILAPEGRGAIQPGQVRPLAWHAVPEPDPIAGGVQDPAHLPVAERATRFQPADATPFNRGEGCWFEGGFCYFATTGDSRVWKIDTLAGTIEILYDLATAPDPQLTDPDNVLATSCGDVYIAEDAGDLQIVALTAGGAVTPVVQLTGQTATELTGPALSPDGKRLYFSSQRNPGTTYEVTGPFAPPAGSAVPALGGVATALLAGALAALGAWNLRLRTPPLGTRR